MSGDAEVVDFALECTVVKIPANYCGERESDNGSGNAPSEGPGRGAENRQQRTQSRRGNQSAISLETRERPYLVAVGGGKEYKNGAGSEWRLTSLRTNSRSGDKARGHGNARG